VLEHGNDLAVEVDLHAVGFGLRLGGLVAEMTQRPLHARADAAVPRETRVLLDRDDRVLRVLVEDAVDRARVEVQRLHTLFVSHDERPTIAPAESARRWHLHVFGLLDRRDR